jgi:adsorption protein B
MADMIDIAMRAFTLPVCASILVNGLDDLFIDVNYYLRGLFDEEEGRIMVGDLRAAEPKRIALMVPTWHEAGVIRQMLELNLRTLDYPIDRYDIFVGTYRNDKETQQKVDEVVRRVSNVHKVVTPHDGPTCKADNLNWVYQGIQLVEEQRGERFDILLMHDAEDIIHPLALRLYNYLIPEYDFVQTPVFPLETPWHKFVAATYKDEFTEHHLKDMLVREKLGGLVPSAGVGSGFARDVFEEIALEHKQQAFNVSSLTEDYEIGLKFRLAGKKVYFARRAVRRYVTGTKGIFRKREVPMVEDEYIATREYFPDSFRFAVRQRSRWVLGIALQGWEQVGWSGPPAVLYCLWRDRKALLTNFFTVFAYLILLYCVWRYVIGAVTGIPWTIENIFPPGSLLWWLVMSNTLILAWRIAMKFITVHKVYGWVHALLSVPRFFVANVINFLATTKALRQYLDHRLTGEPLRWLKTEHVFPSVEALEAFHRRIGDLLVEREGLRPEDLSQALDLQSRTKLQLGEVLTSSGMMTHHRLSHALANQLELPLCQPEPFAIPLELLDALSEREADRLGVLPLSREPDGAVLFATSAAPDTDLARVLEAQVGAPPRFEFCLANLLELARARAYRRLSLERPGQERASPLGRTLVEAGMLDGQQLEQALAEQSSSGEYLGEILLRHGWIEPDQLTDALARVLQVAVRPLVPDQVASDALRLLGYGFCSLHRMVPLISRPGDPVILAMAQRLQESVIGRVAHRLGGSVVSQLSPAVDIELALAVASQRAWPSGLGGGVPALDGAELQALHRRRVDTRGLWERACANGRGPIDELLASGGLTCAAAMKMRASALGIPLAQDSVVGEPVSLPPTSELIRAGVRVYRQPGGLLVEAPRPERWMTARLAGLFPGQPLGWALSASANENNPSVAVVGSYGEPDPAHA